MRKLHTVNKSLHTSTALSSCLNLISPQSALVLIEDGVYAAVGNATHIQPFNSSLGIKLYALKPDLEARGLIETRLLSDIEVIEYIDFVDLVAAYSSVVAWS
ncbi:MAG: sulfurtransferase complex subunit TusB [Gammaproteobacteria bacterium]|nr:sulfurtransferase complex subunit TusB [Gammaproteobacteria bacterium]